MDQDEADDGEEANPLRAERIRGENFLRASCVCVCTL